MAKSGEIERHTDKYTLIGVLDPNTEEIKPLGLDQENVGGLGVQLHIWDAVELEWVKMQQPTLELNGDLTVSMGDIERLLAQNYWKEKRYEYDVDDNPIYIGYHTTINAATNNTNWYVFKYTWNGGNSTRIQGPSVGSWDNRAGLF